MASGIGMNLIVASEGQSEPLLCKLHVHDPELIGHDAVFSLVAEVEVHRSGGVDSEKTIFSKEFRVRAGETEFQIPRSNVRYYSYGGDRISMRLYTRVKVDDSLLFDTKVSEEQQLRIGTKPVLSTNAAEINEPRDVFSFFAHLTAIPTRNRVITLCLAVIGGIVMLVNAAIGAHDQFSPEAATWFYSHYDSDGDANSPLVAALIGSGALGAGIWFLIRRQLRQYMSFRLAKVPGRIERGVDYPVAEMFAGSSRVPLEDVVLRIVACNLECGQYRERRGTQTVTVSFREPVRGVVLYEKRVARIPARIPIASCFNDRVSFDPMFSALYPPAMVADSHGVDLRWEIQLLHPRFIDQELVGPKGVMAYEDFLPG